jgi:hypothetical protein
MAAIAVPQREHNQRQQHGECRVADQRLSPDRADDGDRRRSADSGEAAEQREDWRKGREAGTSGVQQVVHDSSSRALGVATTSRARTFLIHLTQAAPHPG